MLRPRKLPATTTTGDTEMNALRQARMKARLTAFALAERAESKEGRIYAFERGRHRPKRDEALRISAVLGERADDLFPDVFQEGGR
jgi:transcriptional regulator with XRE-family HTH domain